MGRERKRGAGPMEGCFKVTHLLNDRNRRRKISDGDFNTSPRGFSCPPPFYFTLMVTLLGRLSCSIRRYL